MQIKNGTITVTQGTSLVYTLASSGGDWSEVTNGCMFTVVGTEAVYFVNSELQLRAGALGVNPVRELLRGHRNDYGLRDCTGLYV